MSFDCTHFVISNILSLFPTLQVEDNLTLKAKLKEDLDFSDSDIIALSLYLDRKLQALHLPSFTIRHIAKWRTVKDIVKTISEATFHH